MHVLVCQKLACDVLVHPNPNTLNPNPVCPMRAGAGKLACGGLTAAAGGRGHTRRHEHAPTGLTCVPYPGLGEKLGGDSRPAS